MMILLSVPPFPGWGGLLESNQAFPVTAAAATAATAAAELVHENYLLAVAGARHLS